MGILMDEHEIENLFLDEHELGERVVPEGYINPPPQSRYDWIVLDNMYDWDQDWSRADKVFFRATELADGEVMLKALEKGADPNLISHETGETAMHNLAEYTNTPTEWIDALIDAGFNMFDHENDRGRTAVRSAQDPEFSNYLTQKIAEYQSSENPPAPAL